jgi:adenylate cyclase
MAVHDLTARIEAGTPARTGGDWRRLLTRGAPIFAVVFVMAVVSLIAAYIYDANRRGAVTLSNDLLNAIDRRITVEMGAYLSPAEQYLQSARAITGPRSVFEAVPVIEPLLLRTMPRITHLAGFSYGDPDGNFMYVTRNPAGGYDTKLIDRRDGGRKVTWTRRDAKGQVTGTETDPSDDFDPRTRPWYRGAQAAGDEYWSEAYVFFTLRKAGITYSLPHYDDQTRLRAVSGIDIELASLSTFLKSLEIGLNGRAIVVDNSGRVIAFPSENWVPQTTGEALPRLDEMGDPVLTRVYNRLRVEGYGRKILDFETQRIIVSSGPLKDLLGRDWSVLIVVPESDFVGFVAQSGWIAVGLSIVVFLIMMGLAGLMISRSLKSERRDRGSRLRQNALELRAQTFADLASTPDLIDRSRIEGVQEATERAALTCRAKRVGVWYLTPDGRTFVCEDCFDRQGHAHTAGAELHRDELTRLFAILQKGHAVDALDIRKDEGARELAAVYLEPLGTETVYIAPIRSREHLLGMLMIEDPNRGNRGAGLAEFCGAMASLLALRYLPGSRATAQAATAAPAPDPQVLAQEKIERAMVTREVALQRMLLKYSTSLSDLSAGYIEQAVVAVIRLPEWMAIAQSIERGGAEKEGATRMDAVIDEIRRSVARSGVAYAMLLDDQVVLATFSTGRDSLAVDARVVAMAAIDVRDRLIDATAGWGEGGEFRIALDIGSVMASSFGDGAERSLWGGAIGIAKLLAASGGRRAITVSEAAYMVLSGDFLFRQRGTYFLPETGTMRTFVLVGEL